MLRILFSAIVAVTLCATSLPAQTPQANSNSTQGLELPADKTVSFDEGFVKIEAKTKGTVKWLVVSNQKVKYLPAEPNGMVLSIPPQPGLVINVYAVAVVEGQLTDFVRTNVTVGGNPPPPPLQQPPPNQQQPNPVQAPKYHFTFILDLNAATPEQAQLLNSVQLRNAITQRNSFFRIYDSKSPTVAQKKLDAHLQGVGGKNALVVQRDDGTVVYAQAIPATEQDVMAVLKQLTEK